MQMKPRVGGQPFLDRWGLARGGYTEPILHRRRAAQKLVTGKIHDHTMRK